MLLATRASDFVVECGDGEYETNEHKANAKNGLLGDESSAECHDQDDDDGNGGGYHLVVFHELEHFVSFALLGRFPLMY